METRHQSDTPATAGIRHQRAQFARWTGAALAVTLLSILVQHGGPGTIGGQRVSGTSDVSAITAFYSHAEMVLFWWQGGVSFLGVVVLALAFRAYVRTFALTSGASLILDAATAFALLESPLVAVELGLQAALVQVVAAGSTGAPGVLPLFTAWDWIYNSFLYWIEAAWMAGFAAVAWRVRALPRWLAGLGGAAAAGLFFNSLALPLGIPDNATLVPTALFVAWFASTTAVLLRGGAPVSVGATPQPALAAAS